MSVCQCLLDFVVCHLLKIKHSISGLVIVRFIWNYAQIYVDMPLYCKNCVVFSDFSVQILDLKKILVCKFWWGRVLWKNRIVHRGPLLSLHSQKFVFYFLYRPLQLNYNFVFLLFLISFLKQVEKIWIYEFSLRSAEL